MSEAPLTTAGADTSAAPGSLGGSTAAPPPAPPAPAVDANAAVTNLAQAVADHPAIPAESKASVFAAMLNVFAQAAPAAFSISRASNRTQAEVGLGLGLVEAIVQIFASRGA